MSKSECCNGSIAHHWGECPNIDALKAELETLRGRAKSCPKCSEPAYWHAWSNASGVICPDKNTRAEKAESRVRELERHMGRLLDEIACLPGSVMDSQLSRIYREATSVLLGSPEAGKEGGERG